MTITRAFLRRTLQDKGFTYREARSLVTVIIDALTKEVKKGAISTPFGTLTMIKPEPGRAYRLGKIVRTGRKPKVHFRSKK